MLTVIDGRTILASNLKTGSADAIVVDAKTKRVYLLGYESSSLTVLNSETSAIRRCPPEKCISGKPYKLERCCM
jgi:hypothetical protein